MINLFPHYVGFIYRYIVDGMICMSLKRIFLLLLNLEIYNTILLILDVLDVENVATNSEVFRI